MLEKNNPFKLTMETLKINNAVETIHNGSTFTYKTNGNKYFSYGKKLTYNAKHNIVSNTDYMPCISLHEVPVPYPIYFKHITKGHEDIAVQMLIDGSNIDRWEVWGISDDGSILDSIQMMEMQKLKDKADKLHQQYLDEVMSLKDYLELHKVNHSEPKNNYIFDIDAEDIPF